MKKLLFLVLLLTTFKMDVWGQTLTASAYSDTIYCGLSTPLMAVQNTPTLATPIANFNSGMPAGWTASKMAVSVTANSCTPAPNPAGDGTANVWPVAGSTASTIDPRYVASPVVNVLCGGSVTFDLYYPPSTSACSGPDLGYQGMKLQYSTGGEWKTMFAADPNLNSEHGLGLSSFIGWHTITLSIPGPALTASTQFRWMQDSVTVAGTRNFAIDNIEIRGACTNPHFYTWSPAASLSASNIADPIAKPSVTTTYTVTYGDGIGPDRTATVTVYVVPTSNKDAVNAGTMQSVCDKTTATMAGVSLIPTKQIYSTFSLDSIPVSDLDTSYSSINVGSLPFNILSANSIDKVCMNIRHTRDTDLDVFLISPNGSRIELSTDNPAGGVWVSPNGKLTADDGYINTCFSASAANSIHAPLAAQYAIVFPPYTGTYRPEQAFSALTGNANGVWTLAVYDDRIGEGTGFIKDWNITFNTPPNIVWSSVDTTVSGSFTPVISPKQTTTYTLSVTPGTGCTYTDTVTVFVKPLPVVTASATASGAICSGETTSTGLTSSLGSTTYNWTVVQSGVTGASAGSTTDSIKQVLINSGTTAGTAVYSITPTSDACAGAVLSHTVTVNPIPSISNAPSTSVFPSICSGVAASYAPASVVASTYSWTASSSRGIVTDFDATGSGAINDVVTNTGSIADTITYVVTPTSNTTPSCPGTSVDYTVIVNPMPNITNTNSELNPAICSGDNVSFTPSFNITGTTYTWAASSASGITGFTSSGATPIADVLTNPGTTPGTVTYAISPTSPANCTTTNPFNFVVTVNELPVADAGQNAILPCGFTSTNLNGSASSAGVTYAWTTTNGNIVSGANTATPTVDKTGTYDLKVTTTANCESTDNVQITVQPNPIASFNITSVTKGTVPFTVTFQNTSQNANEYTWDFGDDSISTVFSPSHTYTTAGTYTVCLDASYDAQCLDKECDNSNTIVVEEAYSLVIPNVFTPNGDGVNDVFKVTSTGLKSLEAEIYNQWGVKQFTWNTEDGGWDGTGPSGNAASEGTYFYIIKVVGIDDKVYDPFKGSFSLLR